MKVLLHICCGVCAGGVATTLAEEGHEVIGYFCNPNIHPEDEYYKRVETARIVAEKLHFPLEAAPYAPEEWLEATELLKHEPEGGKRCPVCFRIRLKQTFDYLKLCGADAFTTTLTVSPHKSAETVNAIGRELGGDKFLTRDFKKKDGFKKAAQLASQWGLYQQNYCGCSYSMRHVIKHSKST